MKKLTFHTIHWLPQHLAQMPEWQEICRAYDYLFSKQFEAIDEIYRNQFLDSLTEIGCLIWERFLGVSVEPDETLEERRQAINSYFVGNLPYTENKLRETLERLVGPDGVTLTVTQSIYEIKVDLTVNAPATLSNVQDIVYKMRPSNMIVRICIHYTDVSEIFVGLAIKQIKTLTPTSPTGGDPIAGKAWLVDTDSALLVDETGGALYE